MDNKLLELDDKLLESRNKVLDLNDKLLEFTLKNAPKYNYKYNRLSAQVVRRRLF